MPSDGPQKDRIYAVFYLYIDGFPFEGKQEFDNMLRWYFIALSGENWKVSN